MCFLEAEISLQHLKLGEERIIQAAKDVVWIEGVMLLIATHAGITSDNVKDPETAHCYLNTTQCSRLSEPEQDSWLVM